MERTCIRPRWGTLMKKLTNCVAGVALAAGILGAGVATSPAAEARGCTNCVHDEDAGFGGGGMIARESGWGGGIVAPRVECGWC